MANSIQGVLLDTEKRFTDIATLDGSLEGYYKALHCDTIDIVTRKIDGKYYSIVCDDEALLKDKPIVSALTPGRDDALFGSLFLISPDVTEEGECMGLTDEQCKELLRKVIYYYGNEDGETVYPLLIFTF